MYCYCYPSTVLFIYIYIYIYIYSVNSTNSDFSRVLVYDTHMCTYVKHNSISLISPTHFVDLFEFSYPGLTVYIYI